MGGRKCFAYVSSWSHAESASGLRQYAFDTESGRLELIKVLDDRTDFNFSFVDPRQGMLYALDESLSLPGMNGGGGRIFAFRLDPETGAPALVSCTQTCCASPSYLALDKSGGYMVVSNNAGKAYVTKLIRDANGRFSPVVEYDDSAVELFTVRDDGGVGELVDAARHHGSGPEPRRQCNPHPHSAVMSPSGRLFAVCDKGNDHVYMYAIDRAGGRLVTPSAPHVCPPGSQPRYCLFHPELPYFYHNNEGTTEVFAYRYGEDGRLEPLGAFDSVLPENAGAGKREQQGFCIDRAGDFIYDIARCGGEYIAVFRVDRGSGALRLIQNVKMDIVWPRGCALSPDGRFLAVCGMKSGSILVYAVSGDGTLTGSCRETAQPCAGYISFYQP